MGGCRCYFRECHVSCAKFPRIRFFRFPVRDPKRFEKWLHYSKMERMMEFSELRRKNTSVCARHFRPECFMNYKMNRLTPNAVPTIMRLSDDQAIDFELDIENGILVTMEKPKLKHLIPPDDFECPFFLKNDKVLLDILNELQNEQYSINVDYIDLGESEDCEKIYIENSPKSLVNSVEILESIQVTKPSLKRQQVEEEKPVDGERNKKIRILNISGYGGDEIKESTDVFSPRSVQLENCEDENSEINFVETIQIENANELENNESNFFVSKALMNGGCAEDIELFEIHKSENDLHCELPLNDSDATIVLQKSSNQVIQEFSNMKQRLLEFAKKSKGFDALQVKFSILQTENNDLKKDCEELKEIEKKYLLIQMENNNLKKSLKDLDILKDKFHKYYEENKKLKEEVANTDILKSELLSRKEETKELKKTLETLKNEEPKLNTLRRELALSQKQLKDTLVEFKELKVILNKIKNENDNLKQREIDLNQSLNDIQTNFDLSQSDYTKVKSEFDNLRQKYSTLEQKFWKLQALQNQESIVSTSLEKSNIAPSPIAPMLSNSASTFTKGQLFNGIKRYLSTSMATLLRMEMFGSSEREWKNDERQLAVDILRLGEVTFKFFTDEWRIRLPALRDVRNWSNQSLQIIDEDDL